MNLKEQMTDLSQRSRDAARALAKLDTATKNKLLIAMAFDASHGAVGGVRSLATQALKAGATKAEIAEALRVAYLLTGIGSVYIGSQGLKDVFLE